MTPEERASELREDLENIRSEILRAIESLEPVLSKIDAIEEEVVNVDCVQRENELEAGYLA